MSKFNPLIETEDDGLIIPPVGVWSEKKYKLVGHYSNIFSTSMRNNRWFSGLVYIDLFAGAGFAQIRESGRVLYNSAFVALSSQYPFSRYILCERDPEKYNALCLRVNRLFPEKDCVILNVDSNYAVDEIRRLVPSQSLCFCFVDPYSLNLHFNTIKKLSVQLKIDFLILLALYMDAKRNYKYYIEKENDKIDLFLGDNDWRKKITQNITSDTSFVRFLASSYSNNMLEIAYKQPQPFEIFKVGSLQLYYLAFYSKHELGNKFWTEVKKASNEQPELPF